MSRLSPEKRSQVRRVFKETGSIRATAARTKVSRNAVRRILRPASTPDARQSSARGSKLDPYKAKIEFLAREKDLTGVRILEEIKELGYDGGYSILKEYLRKIRPKPRKRPTPPIDHPPGHEAQMDWSPHTVNMGGQKRVVQTGSIILCFSRWLFVRFFQDQTLQSVISLHEQAFEELGAVPHIITYDNMTTVGRHVGPGEVWLNPVFERFAQQYGFKVVILPPGKKERHGMVERPFYYIENNFLKGREFGGMQDLNDKSDAWRARTCNVRKHGTLKEKPMDRLTREKSFLLPLPCNVSGQFYKELSRLVHVDFCVSLNTNRYSVNPVLIGDWVKLRLYQNHLEIWFEDSLHCRHEYGQGRDQRQILPEHEEQYKKMSGQKALLEKAFLRLGEAARAFYLGLQKEKKAAAGYHLQRILKYVDRFGQDVVAGALNYACRYGAYSADTILRIIKGQKLRPQQSNKTMPKEIQLWLKAQAVEKHSPGYYDKIIHDLSSQEDRDGKNTTG